MKLNRLTTAEAEYFTAQCLSPVLGGRTEKPEDFCLTLHCETPIVGYRKTDGGNKKPWRGVDILSVKGTNRERSYTGFAVNIRGKPEGQKVREKVGEGR